ncbi:hypothetical protein VULLAG_LOCUS5931 [Vulpes lagopus]
MRKQRLRKQRSQGKLLPPSGGRVRRVHPQMDLFSLSPCLMHLGAGGGRASAYGVPKHLVTAWSPLLQLAVSHLHNWSFSWPDYILWTPLQLGMPVWLNTNEGCHFQAGHMSLCMKRLSPGEIQKRTPWP